MLNKMIPSAIWFSINDENGFIHIYSFLIVNFMFYKAFVKPNIEMQDSSLILRKN